MATDRLMVFGKFRVDARMLSGAALGFHYLAGARIRF
jgi:hypothetical protein